MPELPEVETVRRGLEPVLLGARIITIEQRRADLRFPFPERFAQRLEGRRVLTLRRRAKYLLAALEGGETLLMHLGMSGSFAIEPTAAPHQLPATHDHVILHLEGGARVRYHDPRRFGFMLLVGEAELATHPLLCDLGVEPLGNDFHAGCLAVKAAGRRTPLKSFLLDQKVIAGLGNIYVCEALFRARLSPQAPASRLARRNGAPSSAALRLAPAIVDVLREAIDSGGSSLRDHRQTDGSLGYFQHRFEVYDREGETCVREGCGSTISRLIQGGRSTFFCPRCQR